MRKSLDAVKMINTKLSVNSAELLMLFDPSLSTSSLLFVSTTPLRGFGRTLKDPKSILLSLPMNFGALLSTRSSDALRRRKKTQKGSVSSDEIELQLTDQLIEVRDRTVAVDVMLGRAVVQSQMPTRQIDEGLLPTERRTTARVVLLIRSFRLVTGGRGIGRGIVILINLIEAAGTIL